MPNVNYVHPPALFEDSVHHAIDVRLVAVKQMAEIRSLRCHRAPVRMLLKAENGLFEAPVPFQRSFGVLGVDFGKKMRKVALRSGSDVNEVCHIGLRTRRRIPLLAAPCPPSRPSDPGECPPPHQPERQHRAGAGRLRRPAQWLRPSPLR